MPNKELDGALLNLGLDPQFLPKQVAPANVFRATCGRVTKENPPYPAPVRGQSATLELRLHHSDTEQMVYHILRNVTDGKREKAHQDRVGEIRFNRGRRLQTGRVAGSESYHCIIRDGISPQDHEQVSKLIERFDATYTQLTTFRDSADVRTILREYLATLNAIAVKPQGALYFVGTEHQDVLDRLQKFVRVINPENLFHQVPLIDTEEQRDMLGEAFVNQLIDEATGLMAAISRHRAERGRARIEPRRYAAFLSQYDNLIRRRDDAQSRLDRLDDRAVASLDLVYEALTDMAKSTHRASREVNK